MSLFKPIVTTSRLAFLLYLAACLIYSSVAKEPSKVSECLKLPEATSETDKAAAEKLHQEVLAMLRKPADETTMAFNFKLIDAFFDPMKKFDPKKNSLNQLILIQTLGCIQKHHMGEITRETFDQMKLDLIFAIVKSMGEHNLPVAKEKLAARDLGPEKMAALAEIGI
jgi:hypothetical protein